MVSVTPGVTLNFQVFLPEASDVMERDGISPAPFLMAGSIEFMRITEDCYISSSNGNNYQLKDSCNPMKPNYRYISRMTPIEFQKDIFLPVAF